MCRTLNDASDISALQRRVELLEGTVEALIGVIETKLNIDPWDDGWAVERFREFNNRETEEK